MAHGHVDSLSAGEITLTAAHQERPPSTNRAWDYWVRQIEKAGLMPAKRAAAAKRAKPAAAKAKAAKKSKAKKRR
jgi:hypothetical protein